MPNSQKHQVALEDQGTTGLPTGLGPFISPDGVSAHDLEKNLAVLLSPVGFGPFISPGG
jgi:hypothetical protein